MTAAEIAAIYKALTRLGLTGPEVEAALREHLK